jgi:transcriptional regulator with XRE-family HTH domain
LNEAFGDVIGELRDERGVSQERLGIETGIHRTTFSLMERGLMGPSLATVFRLAEAFGLHASELLRRVENKRPIVPLPKPGHGHKR